VVDAGPDLRGIVSDSEILTECHQHPLLLPALFFKLNALVSAGIPTNPVDTVHSAEWQLQACQLKKKSFRNGCGI